MCCAVSPEIRTWRRLVPTHRPHRPRGQSYPGQTWDFRVALRSSSPWVVVQISFASMFLPSAPRHQAGEPSRSAPEGSGDQFPSAPASISPGCCFKSFSETRNT